MTTPPIPYAPEEAPLFDEIRQRPGLLLRELAWRWGCAALLLAVAGYDAYRIWAASLPRLSATGVFALSPDGVLENPLHLLDICSAVCSLYLPQTERAFWGLAPLAIFCWALAFGFGRTAVLARFDPRLPRRPWLLAESEAVRLVGLLFLAVVWGALVQVFYRLLMHGGHWFLLLICCAAVTVLELIYSGQFRRAMVIALALALMERRSLWSALPQAWGMHRHEVLQPLNRAVGRIRFLLLLMGLALAFVPAPFGLGWPLFVWWGAWSLPPLALADAWRLGAFFSLVQALRGLAEKNAVD